MDAQTTITNPNGLERRRSVRADSQTFALGPSASISADELATMTMVEVLQTLGLPDRLARSSPIQRARNDADHESNVLALDAAALALRLH